MFGTERVAAENRDYQRRLAASLIGTMGVEGALQTCLAHGWEGVIENVLSHADRLAAAGFENADGWRLTDDVPTNASRCRGFVRGARERVPTDDIRGG